MAGRSISAHTDAETVARLRHLATREGRTPSQIIASSLKLYLDLPSTVRAGLRDIEALGTPEAKHNLMRALGRTVASVQYEVARNCVAEEVVVDGPQRRDDGDVLAEAVRVTRRTR